MSQVQAVKSRPVILDVKTLSDELKKKRDKRASSKNRKGKK